jgi:EAL domain-containing protein (putative c-di-GMP-specific phosphodiesterase class I)
MNKSWKEWVLSGKIFPVFQPVVSADSREVYGYEILGRRTASSGWKPGLGSGSRSGLVSDYSGKFVESLGEFFLSDASRPEDQPELQDLKTQVDQYIRSQALEYFARLSDPSTTLFLNVSPSSMLSHIQKKMGEIPFTIQKTRELGIDPSRIIIEITEERIPVGLENLAPLVELYRKEGFRIAVDDLGSEASNLDRIGIFHPDIIKVDLQMLRRSVFSRNFKEILVTLSKLGESLGSAILFEGIETNEELFHALDNGARYLQGFYFAKPREELYPKNYFFESLTANLEEFQARKMERIQTVFSWESEILDILKNWVLSWTNSSELTSEDLPLPSAFPSLPGSQLQFFRMYITDARGVQISPNLYPGLLGEVESDPTYLGRNWSWRPYFFEHVYKNMGSPGSWAISGLYHDISENAMLKTFSRDLTENSILFIDIIYPEKDL